MCVLVASTFIVKLLDTDISTTNTWRNKLTIEMILSTIKEFHHLVLKIKDDKIATILGSEPVTINNKNKNKVLCEYAIPIDEIKDGSLMRDLQLLNL